MAEYYYSGQGCVFAGVRNANTGEPMGMRMLGNVPELELSVDVTKFEHKESKTGQRAIDLTIITEKNASFRMILENADPYNLALLLWGNRTVVPAGVSTDAQSVAYALDLALPLAMPDLQAAPAPTVNTAAGGAGANLVAGTDYVLDMVHGTITYLSTGSAVAGTTYYITATHGGHVRVDAFTQTSMERYLRFHGLNTVDNEAVIVDLYRASIDPLAGYALINEELVQLEANGNILLDALKPAPNQFMHQINLGAVEGAP